MVSPFTLISEKYQDVEISEKGLQILYVESLARQVTIIEVLINQKYKVKNQLASLCLHFLLECTRLCAVSIILMLLVFC